jgi:outer membrane protein assembly factor BamB
MNRRPLLQNCFSAVVALSACAMAFAFLGCQSTDASSGSRRSSSSSSGAISPTDPRAAAEVEQKYVVGPAAAREFNYGIDWQYIGIGGSLKLLSVQGDSVFALDGRNFLTRIKIDDGARLWRSAVAEPVEEILGVTFVKDRVFVTTGGAMLVLEAANGSQIAKQPLEKIANTAPVVYGDFLIYGSRNGQAVWHSSQIGYFWRGYLVSQSIQLPPQISDDYLVVVGNDGVLMVLSAASATQYWSKKLLDEIQAPPAVGQNAVYVASLDQYLWGFDIVTGRNLWKVLTESPLTQPPALIGERIYQQIPNQGLVCFNAVPVDRPGGEKIWQSEDIKGNVICQNRDRLFAWDESSRQLTVVDPRRGGPIKSVHLPKVGRLLAAGENNNELYAAGDDGRIVRLVPR